MQNPLPNKYSRPYLRQNNADITRSYVANRSSVLFGLFQRSVRPRVRAFEFLKFHSSRLRFIVTHPSARTSVRRPSFRRRFAAPVVNLVRK